MTAGIYKITNKINGKIYIGSSNNIKRRFQEHKKTLKANRHRNILLQRSWNKYGKENFLFETTEEVPDLDRLIEREQHFIDTLKPEYNLNPIANSPPGYYERTEEILEKLSNSLKEYYANEPEEKKRSRIEKLSKSFSGENHPLYGKHHKEETKQKISQTYIEKQLSNGENNPRSKLTEEKVLEIKKLYRTGRYKQKELAKMFDMDATTISNIIVGKTWSHLEDNEKDIQIKNTRFSSYCHTDVSKQKISQSLKNKIEGEKNPQAKLTKEDVNNIRNIYKDGQYTYNQIAEKYNVKKATIHKVVRYITWKEIL